GQQLIGKDLCYVLVLSDGLNVNGTDLSEGITSVVGKGNSKVVVSGGLAGDGSRFKTTSILFGNQADSKKVVAMGFYSSDLKVGTGSIGGWDAFGPERKVTESKDNILYKLDDQPALSLYKTYLGSQSEKLPASALLFPLSISMENRKNVVRTVLAVDEKNQSMTFAGDIPQGASVQLMKANFTNLIQGAADAGSVALSTILDQNLPSLTVAISCVGRRLVLGERIEDETEALKKVLPEQTSIVGFYSYGELSPFGYSACELHNQTMTVSIIQEK
ncbi:MAG: FIST signal transduction protein, partial [Pseudobdellovibrionaceae bacterium]